MKSNNIDSTAFEKYLNKTDVKFVYELNTPLPWYRRLFRKLFKRKNKWPKGAGVRQVVLMGDFSRISDEEAFKMIKGENNNGK